jgi:hypothetical protein
MSLRVQEIGPVPEGTARVARATFRKGHRPPRLRDELGAIYDDARFAALFPSTGRPVEAPWRLTLVTVLQFAEGLPDRYRSNRPAPRCSTAAHVCLIRLPAQRHSARTDGCRHVAR